MKKAFKLFLASVLLTGAFYACDTKTPEPPAEPEFVLTADKYAMIADGVDEVTFTATLDGEDVTASSQYCTDVFCYTSPVFTTAEPGAYKFHATYELNGETIQSNEITITAKEVEPVEPTEFDPSKAIKKNVAFFTWTGTWCPYCGVYKGTMKGVVEDYGDNIVELYLYTTPPNTPGYPEAIGCPLAVRRTEGQLSTDGRFPLQGYPHTVVDFQRVLSGAVPEGQIISAYNACVGNSPKTGVMVNSVLSDTEVNVTVTVGAKEEGEYAIGIFLVEDHIIAVQSNGGSQYDHTNVAREIGVDSTRSLFGESVGAMTVGQTIEKQFTMNVADNYKPENLSILVYTLYNNESGKPVIDNAVKVTANGLTGYNYAE